MNLTFDEALKILNIEDYKEKIFNSNSKGELFHLIDYIIIAEMSDKLLNFRDWFVDIVKQAEKNWERPESIFQHIGTILSENIKYNEHTLNN